ncbi:MAG: OmpA family protein [Ignavibacteriaceae bacterium]|nr:OmpA family protein [Ignavibacteriaceae bacterium]
MVENLYKYFNWGRYTALFGALIVLIFFSNCYPQNSSGINNPFNNAFVFGLDGGVTLPQTDYKQSKTGYSFRGVGEYYFNTNSIHLVGLKLKLGSDQIKGEDDRGIISSQDGQRDIPPTFTTSIFSVGLAATYSLSIGDFFFPYISAGVSNLWFDPKDDQGKPTEYNAANKYSKTTYAFNFEFGLRFLVSDKVSLNVSVNPSLPGSDYLDDVAAASNKDTYSSVLIGFSYSPFSSSDADGDGVADAMDRCPDTPAGIKVDEFGCPVDSDNDGVPDYLDECSDTPKGTMVDQKGCPVSETNLNKFLLAADDIFAPNSAMIKVEGKKYLDKVIAQLQKFPDKRWRIEGHMDSNGSKRYLRNLSLDRAKAVLEYFNYFGGLKRENFQVFGMGDNFPIGSNDTEEGRSKNRRIEIVPEE